MFSDQSLLNRIRLSGLAATLVGNGIGRFAYVALMPVLIQHAWFDRTEAASLGAATLLGYLVGAPLTNWLSRLVPVPALMRAALLACSASYFACAWRGGGFVWFCGWRMLAGVGGAVAMVLAPYLVLSRSTAAQRGRASGVVFSGVGVGVMISGTVVPLFLGFGLGATWLLLGGVCLLLTAATWSEWHAVTLEVPSRRDAERSAEGPTPPARLSSMALLLAAYALNAVGYLPHTLFWVDYISRELHQSIATGGFYWAVFGVAAAVGPFVTGFAADSFGFRATLLIGFLLKALGVALPLAGNSGAHLLLSSVLVGMLTPGLAALVSGYTMALVGANRHKKAWGWMTFSFAATQGVTGCVMVSIMATADSYHVLFGVSAWALVMASMCVAAIRPGATGEAFPRATSAPGRVAI